MPVYFLIHLYVEADCARIPDIVDGAAKGLVIGGCQYKNARLQIPVNPEADPHEQQLREETQSCSMEEAVSLAVRDLEDWIKKPNSRIVPMVNLRFLCDFEFASPPEEHPETAEARIADLSFWNSPNHESGRHAIMVDIDTWEDLVLPWGDEISDRNLSRILRFTEQVCERVHPYFGFLDSEIVSDMSSALLAQGKIPIANFYVIIGPKSFGNYSLEEISRAGHKIKRLVDGGLLIENKAYAQTDDR